MLSRSSLGGTAGHHDLPGRLLSSTATLVFFCGLALLPMPGESTAFSTEQVARPNVVIILADDK